MSELPERLRRKYENWSLGSKGPLILLEAANEIKRLRSALECVIMSDTLISNGGKLHDHGPCAEIAIDALKPATPYAEE